MRLIHKMRKNLHFMSRRIKTCTFAFLCVLERDVTGHGIMTHLNPFRAPIVFTTPSPW